MNSQNSPQVLWQPTKKFVQNSHLSAFMQWLKKNHQLTFSNYDELWEWSVTNTKDFWAAVWDYFEIISHSPYQEVHSDHPMPDTKWFTGATLNYAEHIFRNKTDQNPAIIYQTETLPLQEISWQTLEDKVARLRTYLKGLGIKKGDRVAAYFPNTPEATIAFLAVSSLGAIWSSCSPDFGTNSILDRFRQIEPKVLFAVDGYHYGGKSFDKMEVVEALCEQMPSLEKIILVPFLNPEEKGSQISKAVSWETVMQTSPQPLSFEPVPFDHPIWVLYSSGTTGIPKAITHSHGGNLIEHLKYLTFHNDVKAGERFFWFSTTGWMMWNFVQASLLVGATVVLFEGSPGYPDLNILWRFAEEAKINHFGTSAPFLVACMKKDMQPKQDFDFSHLRSIGSTGAPLPPEAFHWVYENIKSDLWLCSMSGGTDVCTAFVGGVPTEPVYMGEIQRRALGCAMYAYDEMAQPVTDEVGEMVITKPMPSMPVFFWDDPDKARYNASYFEMYQGIWRHGDWLKITDRNTLLILGRSDATLNRHGVRIGTAEIYRAVNKISEIKDSLIVNIEQEGGKHYMPLFVVLNKGHKLDETLIKKIASTLRAEYSPRHIPDEVIEVFDIPYTISGKKLEAPVKKILMGIPVEKAANPDSTRNPEALSFFVEFGKGI